MAKPRKQVLIGSLQPLLFCIGMYMVVLISSVFICSSIYRTLNSGKRSMTVKTPAARPVPANGNGTIASL